MEKDETGAGPFEEQSEHGGKKREWASERTSILEGQKERLSRKMAMLAEVLKSTSDDLKHEEKGRFLAPYVEKAAEKLESVSGYLDEKEINELIDESREMIRNRPALVLGGVLLSGFLIGRVLKSAGDRKFGAGHGHAA